MNSQRRHTGRAILRTTLILTASCATAVVALRGTQQDSTAWASGSAAAPAARPLVAPLSDITLPSYIEVPADVVLSFVCPADLAVDGAVKTAVTADNVDLASAVLATYDVAAQGQVAYATVAEGVKVTWTWKLPAAARPGTGLTVRAACGETLNTADATTFKQATTRVVKAINKYVSAEFPSTIEQGSKITVQVTCDQPTSGSLRIRNQSGQDVVNTADSVNEQQKGIVALTQTGRGYDVVATIPADLAAGDYTVQLNCYRSLSDVVGTDVIASPLTSSPALPLKVTVKKLPPTA